MPPTDRLIQARAAIVSNVVAACDVIGIEPTFMRSIEGIEVLDPLGKKIATLRLVLDAKELCTVKLSVHCAQLQRALDWPSKTQQAQLAL